MVPQSQVVWMLGALRYTWDLRYEARDKGEWASPYVSPWFFSNSHRTYLTRLFQPLILQLIPPLMHAHILSLLTPPYWTVSYMILPCTGACLIPRRSYCGAIIYDVILSSLHCLSWSDSTRWPKEGWGFPPWNFDCLRRKFPTDPIWE